MIKETCMSIEIKAPMLPESVADATVITWHKKPGDRVKRDENLVDLETDKVVLEVPSPVDGVLQAIHKDKGAVVVAKDILGIVQEGAVAAKTETPATSHPPVEGKPAEKTSKATTVNLSPSVRRVVAEHDIDPGQVAGSGRDGRITKEDVLKKIQSPTVMDGNVMLPGNRPEQRVPMSRLRARIAERLLNAQHNAAILTTFNEINLQAVMDLRNRYKETFEKNHGVRLGFMSFFTKAVVEALKRFPNVNASIDGTDVVYHGYYDIGVAVSTDRGLVVPILRDANRLTFAQIEKNIAEYSHKARDNQLTMEEMTGGTFTITNGGVFGSLLSTPILNPPQSAILGMHKIEQRAVVENNQIVIRPMMYVALSYDHRIIDGKESVSFLVTIKELLEDPSRLLLDI
jgi:2-oxoglutarate dehydrogenase E2 component (dihydrolipoamide succinyltransferase)